MSNRGPDLVTFDLAKGTVSLDLSPAEIDARVADWSPPAKTVPDGVLAKYARLVSSAAEGAVTIFE